MDFNGYTDFNSHAHVERDLLLSMLFSMFLNFNSHAHVERDHFSRCKNCKYFHFNSHAHVERDWCICNFCKILYISTHTLTWSVTMLKWEIDLLAIISTHTLTWSVTLDVVYIWCLLNVMRTYFFI